MSLSVVKAGGLYQDLPGVLERFSEPDQNYGVSCVPATSITNQPNLVPLKGVDIVDSFDLQFHFDGDWNAFSGTLTYGPTFPYNMIRNITIPYQTGNINVCSLDGHMLWMLNLLRSNNRPHNERAYNLQTPVTTSGYSPMGNNVSSGTYSLTPAASSAVALDFNLRVIAALYMDHFWDPIQTQQGQEWLCFNEVYVSPYLMASTGRNSIPSIQLSPLVASTIQTGVGTYAGGGTAPIYTDDGPSLVYFQRNGWRQPVDPKLMPPLFNWVHTAKQQRYILSSGKVAIQVPAEGQLLAIVGRMYDPTLNSGIGGYIPLSELSNLNLQYGAGINKFNDNPSEHQQRFLRQFGWNPTEGIFVWDMFADTRSNLDVINTYNTAGVTINLDFGTNTPGAGSYVDIMFEYLTLVQRN